MEIETSLYGKRESTLYSKRESTVYRKRDSKSDSSRRRCPTTSGDRGQSLRNGDIARDMFTEEIHSEEIHSPKKYTHAHRRNSLHVSLYLAIRDIEI